MQKLQNLLTISGFAWTRKLMHAAHHPNFIKFCSLLVQRPQNMTCYHKKDTVNTTINTLNT